MQIIEKDNQDKAAEGIKEKVPYSGHSQYKDMKGNMTGDRQKKNKKIGNPAKNEQGLICNGTKN